MQVTSLYDNINSAEGMASTLGTFMAAYYNKSTDKYLTVDSVCSTWRKYLNTFAMEINTLTDQINRQLNTNLTRDYFLNSLYILSIEPTISSIERIIARHTEQYCELSAAESLWEFLLGVPKVFEYTITSSTYEVNVNLEHAIASDYNNGYMINSVTINNEDALYTLYTEPGTYDTTFYFNQQLQSGDTLKISYRTSDVFYHDAINYIIYFRHAYDVYNGNDIFIYANNGWYPQIFIDPIVCDGYKPVPQKFWNTIDSIGLLCDTERLVDEEDSHYIERIRNAYIYTPGYNIFGLRNVLARKLDLIKQNIWISDRVDYPVSNIWEDSVRVDYREIDHYSYECVGITIPDNVVDGSVRVFRNGLLRHIPDDYSIQGDVVVLTTPITVSENLIIDWMEKTGIYYSMRRHVIPEDQIDGIRTTFILPNDDIQVLDKTQVYHNLLRLSQGPDYGEEPGEVTFTYAPASGDNITLIYYTAVYPGQYSMTQYRCEDLCDGINRIFTVPSVTAIQVFQNGGYKEEGKDYNILDNTHIEMYVAPEENSKMEVCAFSFNVPYEQLVGSEFQQASISYLLDGCIKWYIGSLQPSTKYEEITMRLKYVGISDRDFNDPWVTAYITSDTEYAITPTWLNTQIYNKPIASNLYNETINYLQYSEPRRDGYIYHTDRDPGALYGYIPRHPVFDTIVEYNNITLQSVTRIRSQDYIDYKFSIRNTGNKTAENCIMYIYPPMHYILMNNKGGNFVIHCKTPRGLQHDVRYIYISRWSNNISDAITLFPIHDTYYVPRMLLDSDGLPGSQLVNMADYINKVSPILWGYGKWDEAYWDTYNNAYGDIDYKSQYNRFTTFHEVIEEHADRYNYSYLPHLYDPDLSIYPLSLIPGDRIERRLDFHSGIGFANDLLVSVPLAGQYPVQLDMGIFYLNDIYSYQFNTSETIDICDNNPLDSYNSVLLPAYYVEHNTFYPTDINNIHAVIIDTLTIARRTCFFNENHEQTHIYEETLNGNSINTNLFTTFGDIEVIEFLYGGEEVEHYSIDGNKIILSEISIGVEQNDDNNYLIDISTQYNIRYTLNNSYYILQDNSRIYFDKSYTDILIRYTLSDNKYNTGIVVNPLYTPFDSQFIYADTFEPSPETVTVWVSPKTVKLGEPVFVTCQVLDKHGTPVQYQDVLWICSDTQQHTSRTDKFGRSVWILTINGNIHSGETVVVTVTIARKSSYCSVLVY